MSEGKVVNLAQVRERRGIESERVAEVMNAGPFHSFILADGTVELAVDGQLANGEPINVSVLIEHDNMSELIRGLLKTCHEQDLRLKHLRSADQWIVKDHPHSPSLRLVTFDDQTRAFHQVRSGNRSSYAQPMASIGVCGSRRQIECAEYKSTGPTTRAHWHCSNCGTCLIGGMPMWVEGKPSNGSSRAWSDAKLCDECATPTKSGLALASIVPTP